MAARRACVPLPPFFSDAQQAHALNDAGAQWLVTDRPHLYARLLREQGITATRCGDIDVAGTSLAHFALAPRSRALLPRGTIKVTYTSGTTGTPKGVCLGTASIAAVATSLAAAAELSCEDRHLALLPLSTLLENVGGLYAPLVAGGCSVLLPLARVGAAPAGYDAGAAAAALQAQRASTAITVPELLCRLCTRIERGATRPAALRFLAVGGGRVSLQTLHRATTIGLPVYEGYGLSECSSVVTLNTRIANRPGSVGRVLPHAQIRIDRAGEIHVRGATLLRYTGGADPEHDWYATGDLGHVDADGYVYITGRKRNVFITSYGRNVAPEWVESELTASAAIAQAWVHGESRPWNVAVITSAGDATDAHIERAVEAANVRLPHYARVTRWVRSNEPFSVANGQLTTNGRLRREALLAAYRPMLDDLYTEIHA
jgi:long-subunit acyl-CoA synthetase (AMP-forming)